MSEIDLKKLSSPFKAEDIEWRIQSSGTSQAGKVWAKCLAYITSRAIMDRLDEVCGPGRWRNEFKPGPVDGVICGISIKIDNEWITKWDGSDNSQVEATKGGLSGAMKRAGVQWGIGRYLYKFDVAWAVISDSGKLSAQLKNKQWFKWDAPSLPKWATPEGDKSNPRGESTEADHAKEGVKCCGDFVADGDKQKTLGAFNKWVVSVTAEVKTTLDDAGTDKFKKYVTDTRKLLEPKKAKPEFVKCPQSSTQTPVADCKLSECFKTCKTAQEATK